MFINQLREKVGVVFGNPETTSGGKALKFYASIRLDIRPIEPIKNGTDIIGRRVRVKVVKNKVSPPFRIAELEILAAEGISREGGLLDMGVTTGVLDKSGAWINYGKQRIGQGREAAKQYLRENPAVANEIETKVRERSDGRPATDNAVREHAMIEDRHVVADRAARDPDAGIDDAAGADRAARFDRHQLLQRVEQRCLLRSRLRENRFHRLRSYRSEEKESCKRGGVAELGQDHF